MAGPPLARPTDAPPTAHRPSAEAVGDPGQRRTPAPERLLPEATCPRHVAIIMDGNRRWARQRGLPELEGHAAGVEAIRTLLRHAVRRGVPVVTVYAFSRENWARSDDEVARPLRPPRAGDPERDRRAASRRASGSGSSAGWTSCRTTPAARSSDALEETAGGDRLLLNVAFNYAGRTELVDAFRRIAASGGIAADDRRDHDRGRAVHGRPAGSGSGDPDRRRAAAVATS